MSWDWILFFLIIIGVPAIPTAVCIWLLVDWFRLIEKRKQLHEQMYGRHDG